MTLRHAACAGRDRLFGVLLCLCALLSNGTPLARAQSSIYALVNGTAELSLLKRAIDTAGLADALSDPTLARTVFAPNNDAFRSVLEKLRVTSEQLLQQPKERLQSLLLYHVLEGVVYASDVPETDVTQTTAAGPTLGPLTLRRNGTSVSITARGSTANVLTADLPVGAGVVHVVDAVLLPAYSTLKQALESNPDLSTLVTALDAAGLLQSLGEPTLTYTVFAPTNAGFTRMLSYFGLTLADLLADARLLRAVLGFHVVPTRVLAADIPAQLTQLRTFREESIFAVATSSGVSITAKNINATVVEADIPVGVGPRAVVHVVDWAFMPFYPSVLSLVANNVGFSLLAAAVRAEPAYAAVLSGATNFSGMMFAPSDLAFNAYFDATGVTVEQLLSDPAALKRLLDMHIVVGDPLSLVDLTNGLSFTTIGGQTLTVSRSGDSAPVIVGPGYRGTLLGRDGTLTVALFGIDTVLSPAARPLPPPPPAQSLYAAIAADPQLSTLKSTIDTAGLAALLSNPALAYTLFAPNNDAFRAALALLQVTPEQLAAWRTDRLQALLLYHVLPAVVGAASVPETDTQRFTAGGPTLGPLVLRRNGMSVSITARGSTANVLTADLPAGAGVVHVVDAVLVPTFVTLRQALERDPDLSTLVTALRTADWLKMLDDPALTYTIFAPNNAAFGRTLSYFNISAAELLSDLPLLRSVLSFHVVPSLVMAADVPAERTWLDTLNGEQLGVVATNGSVTVIAKSITATVLEADIPVNVGPRSVVHVVDWALVPFYPSVASLSGDPNFSILQRIAQAEGSLSAALNSGVPFYGTLFAPINDAFLALLQPYGITVEQLLEVPKETLRQILEAHIVPGPPLTTAELTDGLTLTTAGGAPLRVRIVNGAPTIVALGSTAHIVGREATRTIAVFGVDTVLIPEAPPAPAPSPSYGGYGGYGGYGYGSAPSPAPYGGYGGYGQN